MSSILDKILDYFPKNQDADEMVNKFPKKIGEFGFDAWGFNVKTIKQFIALGRFMYEDYFEVEVEGYENIPPTGRCLIIANHSGQLPIDAILLGYSLVKNPIAPRASKGMYERFIPTIPFFSIWFSQMGGALGDVENCIKMLNNEEAVMVFPEGAKGISKPWSKRYRLQRFGNGFMYMAKKTGSPIIPVGIAGCEEIMYNFGNVDFLEKFLRFPAAPVLIPYFFKSKVIIKIGKPMYFDDLDDHDYQLGHDVAKVKREIESLIADARKIREQKMAEQDGEKASQSSFK
ncbi:MAG: acyltransferase family protein [Chitinophagales bacterium]|nr:acyltransferase family protein [Chitinophagales bacterium]MCZ2394591.1 acyltransferase family protein [Chitinophagales bacterium]